VKERCFKLLNLEKDKVKIFYKEKAWKRKIDKVTFVGDNFTRKPPKYERFIRPTGLRFKKANITHPELKTTF
jgi:ribosome biogenesis protein NSA2